MSIPTPKIPPPDEPPLNKPSPKPKRWRKFLKFLRGIEAHHNKLSVFFTFLTAIVLVFAFGLSWEQYELEKQNHLVENRPIIVTDQVSYTAAPQKNTVVRLKVDNAGKTVAYDVVVEGDVITVPSAACGGPERLDRSDEGWKRVLSCGEGNDQNLSRFAISPLAPGASHVEALEQDDPPLDEKQIDALKHFKLRIYAFGSVKYNDYTGKHHITRFCSYISGAVGSEDLGGATGDGHTGWTPGFCPDGNTID